MYTITHKDVLYGPGDCTQYLLNRLEWKTMWKYTYIYISDSLCCVAEINSVLNRLYFGRKISFGKLKEQNLSNLGVGEYFLFFFFNIFTYFTELGQL